MPEFAVLQKNAKELTKRLTSNFMKQAHCFSPLSFFAPDRGGLVETSTIIGLVASSLERSNDDGLIKYLQSIKKDTLLTFGEFEEFKIKALIGCYLLKWSQNGTSVTRFINNPLIELFQVDLNIKSMADLEKKYINSCLEVFSQYCSLVFEHQKELAYVDLNKKLGDTIQVEIHAVQHQRVSQNSSWQGVYSDVINTLGMK